MRTIRISCIHWKTPSGQYVAIPQERGISTLEMIVTLVIAGMVIAAALSIYRSTINSSQLITQQVTRQAATMACLDRMMDDVVSASFARPDIRLSGKPQDGQSHLTIRTLPAEDPDAEPTTQVDWGVAPQEDHEDELILYRRQIVGDRKDALYFPVCEHLMAFDAELFNPEGLDDPNAPPSMLDVQLTVYRDDPPDPDKVITVFRTFCLRRR